MQNHILYQAYGGIDYINECRFSLLKYLSLYNINPPADTAIVIYTDQPALFEAYDTFLRHFDLVLVTKEQTEQWKGESNFIHRMKIEIIKDFFTRNSGNLLYCDTDTYAVTPLELLFENIEKGDFYMHEYEGVIDKEVIPSFYKWHNFLQGKTFQYNNKQFTYVNHLKMWNAGVIGISDRYRQLLDDVLALTDVIYKQFQKHTVEQFAFNYCLQQAGVVHSATENIVHYWNLKEFRFLLRSFFVKNEEESIPNLVKLIHHINTVEIQQNKEQYGQLPVFKKWLMTLTGKNWSIKQYERKF
ncbi:MAG: hypothetical protein ICV51_01320 [Flavisolibacter sp.]|nr:hypothetical protein [Flavisolibacter sp.]MBD0374257.1 hypothetical protein [Flavisolibacter sp.]